MKVNKTVRQWSWMITIWAMSVLALGVVSMGLRLLMTAAGLKS
jgi:hypothetical protein